MGYSLSCSFPQNHHLHNYPSNICTGNRYSSPGPFTPFYIWLYLSRLSFHFFLPFSFSFHLLSQPFLLTFSHLLSPNKYLYTQLSPILNIIYLEIQAEFPKNQNYANIGVNQLLIGGVDYMARYGIESRRLYP